MDKAAERELDCGSDVLETSRKQEGRSKAERVLPDKERRGQQAPSFFAQKTRISRATAREKCDYAHIGADVGKDSHSSSESNGIFETLAVSSPLSFRMTVMPAEARIKKNS